MSDLVELLNDLNQGNRIEYSDYSQLMFCVEQLEKEIAEWKEELYNLRQGVLMILQKNCTNKNEMYRDLERLYNGD